MGWQPQAVGPAQVALQTRATITENRVGQPAPSLPAPSTTHGAVMGEVQSPTIPMLPDLPKEGGPLTPEQVRAMKARLQRTLDERSGR